MNIKTFFLAKDEKRNDILYCITSDPWTSLKSDNNQLKIVNF